MSHSDAPARPGCRAHADLSAADTIVQAMTVDETTAGTPVITFSQAEYDAYLESEVRSGTGLSVAEFVGAYEAGNLDDADPAVGDLVGLLRIGQSGDRAA